MNKEYIYNKGKVEIITDKEIKTTSYYDNLDKVLIKENLIETIEENIKELKKKYKNFNLSKKIKELNTKKWTIFFTLISIPIFSLLLILLLQGIKLGCINLEVIKKVIGINKFITTFTYPFVIMGSTFYFIVETIVNKITINNIRGELLELDYLKKILAKEKNELNELKKDRTNSKIKEKLELVKIKDKQAINSLNNNLDLYYDLGYNENKYYNYLIDGKIDDKLNNYTKEELSVIKNYLKEKHKVLKKSLKIM